MKRNHDGPAKLEKVFEEAENLGVTDFDNFPNWASKLHNADRKGGLSLEVGVWSSNRNNSKCNVILNPSFDLMSLCSSSLTIASMRCI